MKYIIDYFEFDEPFDCHTSVISLKDDTPQWLKDIIDLFHQLKNGETAEYHSWILRTCALIARDIKNNLGVTYSGTYRSYVDDSSLESLLDWALTFNRYRLFAVAEHAGLRGECSNLVQTTLKDVQYNFVRQMSTALPKSEEESIYYKERILDENRFLEQLYSELVNNDGWKAL